MAALSVAGLVWSVTKDIAESLGMDYASGALVAKVLPNTPAKKAGILPGDVILEVNGKKVEKAKKLSRIIANTGAGKSVQLGIWRHGSKKTINVILGRMSGEKNLVLSQDGQQPSVELGLTLQEITAQTRQQYKLSDDVKGVLIVDVKDGSPAAGKGLQAGDVIVMVNQEKVSMPKEVVEKVKRAAKAKRNRVLLLINHQGTQQFVIITIG